MTWPLLCDVCCAIIVVEERHRLHMVSTPLVSETRQEDGSVETHSQRLLHLYICIPVLFDYFEFLYLIFLQTKCISLNIYFLRLIQQILVISNSMNVSIQPYTSNNLQICLLFLRLNNLFFLYIFLVTHCLRYYSK